MGGIMDFIDVLLVLGLAVYFYCLGKENGHRDNRPPSRTVGPLRPDRDKWGRD